MAEQLTPQQKQAVDDRGGQLLVSAAAGSGKTKVLVDRLMKYLTDPVDPAELDEFLIITYTKAAASELRGKIAAKLSEHIAADPENRHLQKQMQRLFLTKISTVHGFCSDLLREYAYRLDLPADFRVADDNECRELRETVMEDLLDRAYMPEPENEAFRFFVDNQGLGRDDRLIPDLVMSIYDSATCHLDPRDWLEGCLRAARVDGIKDASETVWGAYLVKDLRDYLDSQIPVLEQCAKAADGSDRMEKIAANLRDTLFHMQELRSAKTWDEISKKSSFKYDSLSFPRKDIDEDLRDRIKASRKACKDTLTKKLLPFAEPSARLLPDLERSAVGIRGLTWLVQQFARDYGAAKRSRHALDFSDLEQKTLDLLRGRSRGLPTRDALEIGRRYREVLVDEYQDSNEVQDSIFSALTQERQNGFFVGDVKQSIYQFRLADPEIFLTKYDEYVPASEAEKEQGRKVLLCDNFRSGPEVIAAVNDVFYACMRRSVGGLDYGEAEALREGESVKHKPLPGAVELYALEAASDRYSEEAEFVADRIASMLREGTLIREGKDFRPVTPQDIVILLRSPGSSGFYFRRALEARGIRCASGGGEDLLKTEEISTLRAFLQTIANPRQDIPLLTTLASPIFGFTADDLAAIRSEGRHGSFYDAMEKSQLPKARDFLRILDILRRKARMETLTVLLEACFTLTHLDSIYAAMDDGRTRTDNLQSFYQLAANCEKGNLLDLSQFLDHLNAMEKQGLISGAVPGSESVSIMSIHKSKGLEFPVVFLCNLSKAFNREDVKAQILCDKTLGVGLSVSDTENRVRYPSLAKNAIKAKILSESTSEEMRVLYVAMTRARDRLIMTYASKSLKSALQKAALRQDYDGGAALAQDAACMGDWVLMAAMRRTEAGELHALGGKPSETKIGDHPWKIVVTKPPLGTGGSSTLREQVDALPENTAHILEKALGFRYPHEAATAAPSKQTATGRKGRVKDAEAAEGTREIRPAMRTWRRPTFLEARPDSREYGTAIHAVLQYIRYECCGTLQGVQREVARLVKEGFLTEERGLMADCEKIAKFFQTTVGCKLRKGVPHLREFKFSILDSGTHYGEDLEGEQVLLQGVVDCALLEEDGITVVDFKTDRVTAETLDEAARRYAVQVNTYAEALERIFEKKIKAKYLYFFRLDSFVEIS